MVLVNTLGLFSTMQPVGPKLTTPWTSHLSEPCWQRSGPPESPWNTRHSAVNPRTIQSYTVNPSGSSSHSVNLVGWRRCSMFSVQVHKSRPQHHVWHIHCAQTLKVLLGNYTVLCSKGHVQYFILTLKVHDEALQITDCSLYLARHLLAVTVAQR